MQFSEPFVFYMFYGKIITRIDFMILLHSQSYCKTCGEQLVASRREGKRRSSLFPTLIFVDPAFVKRLFSLTQSLHK